LEFNTFNGILLFDHSSATKKTPIVLAKILARTETSIVRRFYAGETIVFTNGCFDVLHVGHVRYLAAARRLGDVLVVGLNSDNSVRELKGPARPLNSEQDRAEVLAALVAVDHVIIFDEKRASNLVRELAPDIYAKGGDYTPETLDQEEVAVLKELGVKVEILPLVWGKSTTRLVQSIQQR
jgi:D-glycero-beta-D-manno-heptose 1-phosphate adenylyltransferase